MSPKLCLGDKIIPWKDYITICLMTELQCFTKEHTILKWGKTLRQPLLFVCSW
jgi:hypothetical protein